MRYLITLVVILVLCPVMAQETLPPPGKQKDSAQYRKQNIRQSLAKGISEPVNKIEEYKIISYTRDTTFLDTTLTIQKEYTYNYLRRDDFELMPFANVGQPYNSLGVDLTRPNLYPKSGARARHFNYLEKEDITYYNVPTPMTDLFFKTTLEQGQLLDAMITFNTSPRFNFSIAYKGFRSLGKYQFNQVESGNFRTTANYQSKNNQYTLRAHIAGQDILGEENGGLIVKELQFESEDPEFRDRSRIDVFFTDARNKVLGKRYFLDHRYVLTRKKDSVSDSSLGIGHEFTYETKYYQFQQDAQNKYFGEDLFSPIDDKAYLKTFFNSVSLDYSNRFLGTVKGYVNWFQYDYFFDSLLITEEGTIPNQLTGNEIAVGGSYNKRIGPFSLDGNLAYGITGELTNYIFDASAKLKLNEENEVSFSAHASSRKPNFNFLLYQSDYANYNWYNAETFEDENVQRLQFDLNSQVWGDLTAQYTVTDNYTYFSSNANAAQVAEGEANAFVTPKQEGNSVNLLKVKYRKEFRLGKWALNNTVMYQNVTQDSQVLNLPQLVTRNTIYFSSDVFK
ncbi:putative porin, partial [Muriicola sp.]|uniref:putative porin n=1 Tax=Muriicola sp. TaxID=2020856 RepID=UPI003561749F